MARSLALSCSLLVAWVAALPAIARAEACDDEDVSRILSPATEDDGEARVDCDLALTPLMAAAITRRLLFIGPSSSGVTLDCHGGVLGSEARPQRILVGSERVGSSGIEGVGLWEPATDVTIRDCEIRGRIHIQGMGIGEWGDEVTLSSHVPIGHVERVREAAPRRITLDGVTLVGVGRTPLYVSIGVEGTTVVRSYITGWSSSVAVYLDAESRGATFRDSMIDTDTPRELMAIDGSEENRIIGNWFSRLDRGGIYLLRNCGERAYVRFTPPQHNEIIDNVFYYERYAGPNPAVFLGSDNGFSTHHFCAHDLAYPFGSGADDRDFAAHNAVMQNQIVGRSADEMIHTEWPDSNTPNYIEGNTTVEAPVSRHSGCFLPEARASRFLAHGASTELRADRDGHPFEHPVEVTCTDGELAYATAPVARAVREVPFGCAVSGDNAGCRGRVSCGEGSVLVSARVACNLEHGPVREGLFASVPEGVLRVVRTSDIALEGRCWLEGIGGAAGDVLIRSIPGDGASYGCREHDRNGGDCEVSGVAYCVEL